MPCRPTSEAAVALEKQAASMRRPDHRPRHGQSGPQLSKISPDLHRILIHFALGVWRPQNGKKNTYNFKLVKKASCLPPMPTLKWKAKCMPNIPTKYQQNIQVNHIQSHPMSNSAIKMASLPSEAEWVVPHLLNVLLLAARHAAKTASPRNPIKFRKQKSAIRFENNRKQQIAKLGSTWFTTFEKHGVTV